MMGNLKIFLALFVLSIAKAKPVHEWEDEEDWGEGWKNVDALNEKEDGDGWDGDREDEDGWDEKEDEDGWDEDDWDEEEDEEAWDKEEDEKAWNEEEDDKPWDEEEDEEAWDEEDIDSGEEDEAWEGGDNTVLQDDLTGGESEDDEFEVEVVNFKRDLDKMATELENMLAY